ncbi:longitudinals lacking protein isoform X3 [Bradysia coprophila]|uniref:longitudinals lacking protein isoform X3 n=1 Tax=Bradysia coprophila TaxID=38358 RepID=UPI00187DA51C|nr:longitudinals lacking protein isoform X3 [Bradysia coprophila]XP_037035557.1 longitudinals lacking protein isoform X3 [Bradysia coprophila]
MDDDQQFCLRWNNHQSTLISVFDTLLENGTLVDCTLAAEGKFLKAHKVVLSACSPYFAALLSQQYDKHPIFILKDIKFQELRAMMDYMYRGEVNISQDQLAALLKAAESLQIKGLSESRGGSTQKNENVVQKQPVPVVSKSGLTIEHKRPANKHPTSAATESDVSMSREGSTSPTSRKRKKFRRRSIEVNNMDNHDQLSNSSSQSQSIHMTSIPMTAASQITSATSAANVLNVTKKTDHHDSKKDMEQSQADDDEDDDKNDLEPPAQRQKHDMDVSHIKEKMQSTHSELLIEPKNEYDDGQDETVEDLTLDDEELLEDLDQAGPSHGGEGSSQGYAQWQVGQNQDEVFLAAQEAAGQHRDAQDESITKELKSTPKSIDDEPKLSKRISSIEKLKNANISINNAVSLLKKRKPSHPRIKYSGVKSLITNDGLGISQGIDAIPVPLPPALKPAPAMIKPNLNIPNSSNSNSSISDDCVKYAIDIDDIELPDGTKIGYPPEMPELKRYGNSEYFFNDSEKLANIKMSMMVAAKAFNEYSEPDIISQSGDESSEIYPCRHCGKKYRWKSTLRRHENDECNNKEPQHSCPYCPYRAKQRGNLGVHVRKHHADLPQLESRRKKRSSI